MNAGWDHVAPFRGCAWLLCLMSVGCTTVFGLDAPERLDEATAPDASVTNPDTASTPRYHATAVRFARSGDDFLAADSLAYTTNSPRGTFSVWVRFHGGDGERQAISVAQVFGAGGVVRRADSRLAFEGIGCAGRTLLDMTTNAAYTSSSGWVHVLASWDLAIGRAQLYVNDVPDRAANPIVEPGNICYAASRWGIGGVSSGELDADVADLYTALGSSIDLDIEGNRRKFSDADGKPVDLGAHCIGPMGAAPTGCFVGSPGTWNLNEGIGGVFTVAGDGLTVAPTSPSD